MLEISCSVACLPAKLQRDRKITPSWCVAELFGLALQSFVGERAKPPVGPNTPRNSLGANDWFAHYHHRQWDLYVE